MLQVPRIGLRSIVSEDLDGDGTEELLGSHTSYDGLMVLDDYNPSTGRVTQGNLYGMPTAFQMALSDFNEDGVVDLVGWGFDQAIWLFESRSSAKTPDGTEGQKRRAAQEEPPAPIPTSAGYDGHGARQVPAL